MIDKTQIMLLLVIAETTIFQFQDPMTTFVSILAVYIETTKPFCLKKVLFELLQPIKTVVWGQSKFLQGEDGKIITISWGRNNFLWNSAWIRSTKKQVRSDCILNTLC